jgi:hypothetical protein
VKHSAKALARQARTERGSGKADNFGDGGSGSGRRLLTQLPYWLVMAGIVAGLATVRGGGQAVRAGTLVIAGALLAGSLARLVLPEGKAGLLGSRRRIVDVGMLGILGIGLLIAGLILAVPRR